MREKMFKKITVVLLLFVVTFMALPTIVCAAGSYSARLASSSIYVGQATNVIISTTNAAGKFTVVSSNPAVAKVSSSATWVDGTMDTAISVTGVKAGTATITVTPVNVSDDEYNLLSGAKYITVTVRERQTTPTVTQKSSDATLKSIELLNGSIDFKSDVTKYTVYVDKTVTTLGLKAIPNNSKAKVEITGDENFVIGTNLVSIKVTAEDGTVKVYEITVIKSKFGIGPLLELKVKGYEIIPEFDPGRLDYTLEVVGVSDLEVEYKLAKETSKVEISGNTNMNVGKNIIKVKVTEENGTVTTYTINVTVKESAANIAKNNELVWKIVIIILAVAVVAETAYIIVKKKKD